MMGEIHILFDGPPSHESARFIETEDKEGHGINVGKWIEKGDYWHLVIPSDSELHKDIAALKAELADTQSQVEEECGITKVLHQRILSLRATLKCYTDSPVAVAALEISRHHCQRADEAEKRVVNLTEENAALKRKQKHGGD